MQYEQGLAALEAVKGQVAVLEEQLNPDGLSEEEKQMIMEKLETAKAQIAQQEQILAQAEKQP